MKKIISFDNISIKILTTCLLLFSLSGSGQDSMTAQKVIQHFVEVSGGEKFLNSLKATSATAKGVLNKDSFTFFMVKECPNKLYTKFESHALGTLESIYNNGKGMFKMNGETIPINTTTTLERMQINSFALADMAYEQLGFKMKLVPSDEQTAFKLELISPNSQTTYKYYDKKTGYLTKVISPEGAISYFSDYFTTNGFTLSRKQKTINPDGTVEEATLEQFIMNPKFDPSIFNF